MQNKHSFLWILSLVLFKTASAQQHSMQPWDREAHLLDRLEIKLQGNNSLNLNTFKSISHNQVIPLVDSLIAAKDKGIMDSLFTSIDRYNFNRYVAAHPHLSSYNASNRPALNPRNIAQPDKYSVTGNLLFSKTTKQYFKLNPVVALSLGTENGTGSGNNLHHTAVGLSSNLFLHKKIAANLFGAYITEKGPTQFGDFLNKNTAVPGAVTWDSLGSNGAVKYWDVRANVNLDVHKYINVHVGYDRNFIGAGQRSLLLSDFSANNLFLKLTTKIWRLKYTNLYMQMAPFGTKTLNKIFINKYASMHHLSINVTKWLNVGAFEAIIFGRSKGYDLSYLNPIIFLRAMETQNGSPDNANIGVDFKANIAKKGQVYGQVILDEFVKDQLVSNNRNWWGNKYGFQIGAKYIDAFGINNLDLQLEFNQVRPFTYQFRDSTAFYSNAGAPLAHPLGANFREIIAKFSYHATQKLIFDGGVQFFGQGLDSAGYNFGSTVNNLYGTPPSGNRLRSYDFPILSGNQTNTINIVLNGMYEVLPNMWLDARVQLRNSKPQNGTAQRAVAFWAGVRWNFYRRNYDY